MPFCWHKFSQICFICSSVLPCAICNALAALLPVQVATAEQELLQEVAAIGGAVAVQSLATVRMVDNNFGV